jgi:hypothetical protein
MKRIPLYLIFTALLAACASETTKPTQTGAQVEDRSKIRAMCYPSVACSTTTIVSM